MEPKKHVAISTDKLKSNRLPTGKGVLNKDTPDAVFDVGSLFIHDKQLFNFLDAFEKLHDYILPIKSVFGCYGVKWMGGRNTNYQQMVPWNHQGWTPEVLIQEYNQRGIGCTYTFSNTLLTEKDLDDPSSNYLLDILASQNYSGNAVAVTQDCLSDYIRKRYPDLKQKVSVCKSTKDMPHKRTFEYYESLCDKFELVYLHPDDNLNLKLLKEISDSGKAEKYIPLINERCTWNCQIRNNHYDETSKAQIEGWHGMFNFSNVDFIHTPSHPKTICPRILMPHLRTCVLSRSEFKRVYDFGFRRFKFQGRDSPWASMLYNFSTYMLEQDYIAEKTFTY